MGLRYGDGKLEESVTMRSIGSTLVLIWLIIGVLAAFQRDYLTERENSCAQFGTIAVTVIAGPLNYVGLNPKVNDCDAPEPSE